jgi:hypothetical protein
VDELDTRNSRTNDNQMAWDLVWGVSVASGEDALFVD